MFQLIVINFCAVDPQLIHKYALAPDQKKCELTVETCMNGSAEGRSFRDTLEPNG